jgi:CheY-like chemotaxis protein
MHFLLLDDEKVSRFTLRQLTQSLPGSDIHEAADAAQARAQLAQLPAPAVCVFDVRLPGESGLDLLAWLRAQPRYQALPVLLFTGNEDDDTRQRAASLHVDGYLPKPPDQDSAARISVIAERLAGDLLPEPRALAQKLGTSPGHLVKYLDALEQQIADLGKTDDEPQWQTLYARCLQVGKALGGRYLVQALQQLHGASRDSRSEWLAAAQLALGGMRERLQTAL